MKLQELQRIGLTGGEIKVYSALLELGECTKTALAKKSGISPSNIYDVTNRLLENGIISKVEKNGIAHFSASNPNYILNYLKNKKNEIDNEESVVKNLMPDLFLLFNKTKEKANVEVFYGWNGLKTVFEELIEECDDRDFCFVFGASKGEEDEKADLFFVKYSKLRAEKKIKTKIIFNSELKQIRERINFFMKSKNYEVKFLPDVTPAEIMLYKNKTCILILTKEPIAIRITSKETMESFKQYFEILWKSAKK